jgi:hypothetical protein
MSPRRAIEAGRPHDDAALVSHPGDHALVGIHVRVARELWRVVHGDIDEARTGLAGGLGGGEPDRRVDRAIAPPAVAEAERHARAGAVDDRAAARGRAGEGRRVARLRTGRRGDLVPPRCELRTHQPAKSSASTEHQDVHET